MTETPDFERLAARLKALAHPARLEILWRLRAPATAGEIDVRPRRRDEGLQAERPMSRQSVMEHIEVLEGIGVVRRLPEPEGAWVTSHQQVFALVEGLRELSAIEPTQRVDVDATMPGLRAIAAAPVEGPRLVLVNGPWEGRAFPLAGEGPWTLGRSRQQSVAISYDPFCSAEHAILERAEGALRLRGNPGARNPPRVNFAPLAADESRDVRAGDVVTLGRSHLVLQA